MTGQASRWSSIVAVLLFAGAAGAASAQAQRPALTFAMYLAEVLRTNLDLAVQQSQVDSARAQQVGARARPDWNALVGLPSLDLSNAGSPTITSGTLSVPIELGGKRGHRVDAAGADVTVAASDYDDAVRQLRGTAAGAFIDALTARNILKAKNLSLAQLERLVTVNQDRLRAGDIGEIELVQARVERDQFRTEVIDAEAEVDAQDVALGQLMGTRAAISTALPEPAGSLDVPTRTFNLDGLISDALIRRPDAASRAHAVESSNDKLTLARANLVPDLALAGTYQHSGPGTGGFAQPADNTLAASLSLNLPLFRRQNPGDVLAAQSARAQADFQLQSVKIRIEAEVRQAYRRYQSTVQRLNLYRGNLLQDSDRVLEARLYAYQRGNATLLEVIEAQRTSDEIRLAYYQALADHAHALVTLEQAAAMWDIDF
jgi:cobalt-zinc-cadmium efflux system outer membrane protein